MITDINSMVESFEKGRMTRRELVTKIGAAVTAMVGAERIASAVQEKPKSTFEAAGLNHIALYCTDIPRSRDFYIKHLGMTVARESRSNCFLNFADNFLALFSRDTAAMNHYCYSIKDYEVSRVEQVLKRENLKPRREGNRIYFNDPDGLTVQLSSTNHRA